MKDGCQSNIISLNIFFRMTFRSKGNFCNVFKKIFWHRNNVSQSRTLESHDNAQINRQPSWKTILRHCWISAIGQCRRITEAKFMVILWDLKPSTAWVKVSSGMGLPCSMKCIVKDIRPALTPSLPPSLYLCLYKKPALEISRQIQMC